MPLSARAVNTGEALGDRRRIERVATNIDAVWLAENDTVDCRLLDVSPTGARLKFEQPDTVPDMFEIYVADFALRYIVETKWRDGKNISVQFLKAWREKP